MELSDKLSGLKTQLKESSDAYDTTVKHAQNVQSQIAYLKDVITALRAQITLLYDLDPSLKETGK